MASKPMTPQLNGQPWNCAECGKPIMGSLEWGETAGAFHPECRSQLFARMGKSMCTFLAAAPCAPTSAGADGATPTQDDRVRHDSALRQIWAAFDDWSEQEKGLARTVWWHANRAALASPAGTVQPTSAATPASEAVVQDAARREQVDAAIRYERRAYFGHNGPNTWLAQTFNNLLMANGTFEPSSEANARREAAAVAALRSLPQQQTGERE